MFNVSKKYGHDFDGGRDRINVLFASSNIDPLRFSYFARKLHHVL